MPSHKSTYEIPKLPPESDFESVEIYKALFKATRSLAELKGSAKSIPNQGILVNSLTLQEARASSAIENIVTTQHDLFRADISMDRKAPGPTKEVALYRDAMRLGWENLKANQNIISNRSLIEQFQLLKGIDSGFRNTGGTVLQSSKSEIIYIPPQIPDNIERHMSDLERFINDPSLCELDPLVKMAIIHHQFESIHPFPDGNGRIGRILNVLYLVVSGLLDIPVLYLSRYINNNKSEYYRYLQNVRDATTEEARSNAWQVWVIYILNAVDDTSLTTIKLVEGIRDQMAVMKGEIRDGELRKLYSQDLINNLFRHPYTRNEFIETDLNVTRKTATKYLDQLTEAGILHKVREGRNNYYMNHRLINLLVGISE
ncbi:MAG: Fic family protein [Patiriisocius sp.]|jgi:Fic family protein